MTGLFVPDVMEPVPLIGEPYLSARRFSRKSVLVPVIRTEPSVPEVAPRRAAMRALSSALRTTVSLRADCCVAPKLARAAARARAAIVRRIAPIAMNNASMSITMSRSMPRRLWDTRLWLMVWLDCLGTRTAIGRRTFAR